MKAESKNSEKITELVVSDKTFNQTLKLLHDIHCEIHDGIIYNKCRKFGNTADKWFDNPVFTRPRLITSTEKLIEHLLSTTDIYHPIIIATITLCNAIISSTHGTNNIENMYNCDVYYLAIESLWFTEITVEK